MCFVTYNHRFENTRRSMLATFGKTENFLVAVLQLQVVWTLVAGENV